ncbi:MULTISPECIES: LysR family transcriptional regulator [Saccharibacillus]|uniref:LysR family transcriptional regulator n=1 Tax=Saccharibacillus TaxID=456492 RepID=UPI00123A3154|nr:LysR family transcriptional regulator [Saccharibacillus sp. WB 17]MWJ32046.1 LysR family transcriptional regulator [Saccharibacillus sp. WB 17]
MDQQLRVFVAVAEKGHFSRAAAVLYMSQPAVSQHIRALEQAVGAQLLERNHKQIRMTRAGEIVYAHAKEILGSYGRMQKSVDDLGSRAGGSLAIGASPTFGEYILPRVLATLRQQYPEVEPSVIIGKTAAVADKVRAGELDVGIVQGQPQDMKPLRADKLADDRMVLVASPDHPLIELADEQENVWPSVPEDPFIRKVREDLNRPGLRSNAAPPLKPTVPEALSAHAWVLRETGSGTREAADDALHRLGVVSPAEILVFGSTQAVKEAVIAGLGLSLLSRWAIRRELYSGELQIVDIPGLPHIRPLSIVTASSFRTRALDVFIELLRQQRELAGSAGTDF